MSDPSNASASATSGPGEQQLLLNGDATTAATVAAVHHLAAAVAGGAQPPAAAIAAVGQLSLADLEKALAKVWIYLLKHIGT